MSTSVSPGRARRTVLAVPGSSPRFLAKARGLAVDEVFLDLEDAVAPAQKAEARSAVAAALSQGDWPGKVRAVRVNDVTNRCIQIPGKLGRSLGSRLSRAPGLSHA